MDHKEHTYNSSTELGISHISEQAIVHISEHMMRRSIVFEILQYVHMRPTFSSIGMKDMTDVFKCFVHQPLTNERCVH